MTDDRRWPTLPLESLEAPAEIAADPPAGRLAAHRAKPPPRRASRTELRFSSMTWRATFICCGTEARTTATLRFLQADRPAETLARLALVAATAVVIRSGLAVMGVTPVEEMR